MSAGEFDLFISCASKDFELCVADFLKSLWRHGVIPVWHDRLRIDVGDSIPLKIDEGLSRSAYFANPNGMAAQRPRVRSCVDRKHMLQQVSRHPVGHQGLEVRPEPVEFRC